MSEAAANSNPAPSQSHEPEPEPAATGPDATGPDAASAGETEAVGAGPPVAKRVPSVRRLHGDEVVDEYRWLVDRDDPDTVAYLEAENAYTASVTAGLADLRDRLFHEIKSRVQETDLSVPSKKGPWLYYGRTIEGQQYGLFCRRPGGDDHARGDGAAAADPPSEPDAEGPADEQVLIDSNELAGDSPYFALGAADVSPNHRLLAYSTDFDGGETYTMRFKDLDTGELLADEIPGTYYGTAWSGDSSVLFYVTLNDAKRPYRLWRHRLGTPAAEDEMVHEETDDRFFCSVHLTRSERFIVVNIGSTVTSEVWVLPSDDPLGTFTIVEPRRQGIEYSVDHQGDRFLILTNDEAENFRLMEAPVGAPGPGRENWRDVIEHRDDTRLDHVDAFAGHFVVHFRRDGLTGLRVVDHEDDDGEASGTRGSHDIEFPEPVYTVGPGDNPEYETTSFRLGYTSLVTPASVYDYDIAGRELILRKRQPVLGGYDAERYESRREWATADDGTLVPISVLRLKETPEDGSAPLLLYGYGSYEISMDPGFRVTRLPLVDRGFVYAIAHIRGGGEMGRRWYESGKLLEKRTTFTDFVAAARHLTKSGYADADRVAIRGGSAGGLLMGAVANLAPDEFRVVVAEVPFVDALNTICDPSLPLTVTEWEEWGNPLEDAAVYRYMKTYSPYENIEARAYPAILATTGLNDPRVGYHEPAKWVARLRATAEASEDRPILLKTEMGAGHGGPSGRYDAWRDEAFVLAFVIDELGAPVEPLVDVEAGDATGDGTGDGTGGGTAVGDASGQGV
jgi:oligopeptidase B